VRHTFSLCEWCLDWLFTRFKLPVAVDDPMNDSLLKEGETIEQGMERVGMVQLTRRQESSAWRPAERRVAEDEWRTGSLRVARAAHRGAGDERF
jgi:hypothetical protein